MPLSGRWWKETDQRKGLYGFEVFPTTDSQDSVRVHTICRAHASDNFPSGRIRAGYSASTSPPPSPCYSLSGQGGGSTVSFLISSFKIRHNLRASQIPLLMPRTFLCMHISNWENRARVRWSWIGNQEKQNKLVNDQTPKETKKMLLNYFKCANISLEKSVIFVKGSEKVPGHLPC